MGRDRIYVITMWFIIIIIMLPELNEAEEDLPRSIFFFFAGCTSPIIIVYMHSVQAQMFFVNDFIVIL